jgi:hypothetical protein
MDMEMNATNPPIKTRTTGSIMVKALLMAAGISLS